MPKLIRGWRLRKAIREIDKNNPKESFRNLLQHLLEEFDKEKRLPIGWQGAQIIELYKHLLELEGATPKETKKNISALEKWITSSTKGADVTEEKDAE